MKYIKKFEASVDEIKIGEYVLLNTNSHFHTEYHDFINNNVGEVLGKDVYNIYVKYRNIPKNIEGNFDKNRIYANVKYIDKHSFDRNELEALVASKKYNL